jgi:hypothetical protein
MKYRLIVLCFTFLMLLSQGCLSQIASFEAYTKNWIGRPMSDLKKLVAMPESYASRIGWQEKTYRLDNGNLVYVEPDRPDCFIHWEVNPEGIIIGYKTEGKRCY